MRKELSKEELAQIKYDNAWVSRALEPKTIYPLELFDKDNYKGVSKL